MSDAYDGCTIPPEVYDVGCGWDARPEIERLLFVCREAGVQPLTALELGCGTGRLLPVLRERGVEAVGLELSPAMCAVARGRSGAEIVRGDMADFQLGRMFDLIFTSANTVRHLTDDAAVAGLWRCVARHLAAGGVFVADLELGIADEAARADRPAVWTVARGEQVVRAAWCVERAPKPETRRTGIAWTFERRGGGPRASWVERFELRAWEAPEFVQSACAGGRLALLGLYELRDPYLFERSPERAAGRMLAAFRGCAARTDNGPA